MIVLQVCITWVVLQGVSNSLNAGSMVNYGGGLPYHHHCPLFQDHYHLKVLYHLHLCHPSSVEWVSFPIDCHAVVYCGVLDYGNISHHHHHHPLLLIAQG